MKDEVLKCFSSDEREEVLTLVNKMELSFNNGIPLFTSSFFTPNIWRVIQSRFSTKEFKIEAQGGFHNCDRRIISFNNIYEIPYPIKVVKIDASTKFKNLSHKDYLGAIMSLGVDRNKFGDLILKNQYVYVAVQEEICDYLIANLTQISTIPCKVTEVLNCEDIPKPQFDEVTILVASLRVDNIITKIINQSRTKAQVLIDQGKVLIDYTKVIDKSKEIQSGQTITIRGFGKFILGDVIGNSKSGKIRIIIKKYT
ncbi:MAG: RNA-binding protein [Clostridium sp.]